MKKLILAIAFAVAALNAIAQFKISGQIENLNKTDTLVLNIPLVYGFYKENSRPIPVSRNGKFSFTLPLTMQKFATLAYKNHETSLLLSPGKALVLTLDTIGTFKKFAGTAGVENDLLHQAKLNEIAFFMHGNRQTNPYAKLTNTEIDEKIVKPWRKTRDELIAKVNASQLSAKNKALINSELICFTQVILNDFARTQMAVDKKQINELIISLYKGAQPEPEIFPAGPMYYHYTNSYLAYLENKAFGNFNQNDPAFKTAFLNLYKISLDSATTLVKTNGKAYIKWYLLNQYFSRRVAEQYLAQGIFNQCHDKNMAYADVMLDEFKSNFPKSRYTTLLQGKVDELDALYLQNKNNENIQVHKDYQKVNSIYEIVNTLKGKVVYLDIWGTWCGPCKEDLVYVPQLKKHFKDKDVVFVYLDMDDDEKDAAWKKFIRVNGMTGIHLRKNKVEIQKFWDELVPQKSKQGFYPACFIFDKSGKLVQADAKRPPDEAALYTQIEKYL